MQNDALMQSEGLKGQMLAYMEGPANTKWWPNARLLFRC